MDPSGGVVRCVDGQTQAVSRAGDEGLAGGSDAAVNHTSPRVHGLLRRLHDAGGRLPEEPERASWTAGGLLKSLWRLCLEREITAET